LLTVTLVVLSSLPALAKEKSGDSAANANDAGPIFYPEAPEQPRIQFLRTLRKPSDVQPKVSGFKAFVLGKDDSEDRPIGKPYGVAVNGGRVFVCDSMSGMVSIFDVQRKRFDVLGKGAKGATQKPINISFDKEGTSYVCDTKLRRVLVYGPDLAYKTAFGEPDKVNPVDAAVLGDELYVCDVEGAQILVLNKADGKETRRFGKKGSKEGELFLPSNIAVDPDGNVYVSDTGNTRVVKFDPQGKFIRNFGSIGDQPGTFTRPKGIALDHKRRLYAVDAAFENVQIFDSEGQLLLFFGSAGAMPGNLCLPAKIAIDYDNVDMFKEYVAPGQDIEYLILVTNQYGESSVNVYGFLKEKAPEK
jgi:sugar lactone lactonase YvrE